MGRTYEIDRDAVSATVSEEGGKLRTLAVEGRALVDPEPPCAGWVLAPWPNRVRDGRYTFDGVEHHLPITEPARMTALHGLVAERPWERFEQGLGFVGLRCELSPAVGYPFALSLRIRYTATDRGVRADHEVENVGARSAPFAFGVHPYLLVPDTPVDALELSLGARARLIVDDRLLPTGELEHARFTGAERIGAAQLDTAYAAGPGPLLASLRAPDGRGVELWADASFRWWQVYTGARSVAIEPMTAPPDALNSGVDLLALGPGEVWRGSVEIRSVPGAPGYG